MRHLAVTDAMMEGDDVKAVQRKIGLRGKAVDGIYGPITAARVEQWKWKIGYRRITPILGLRGQAWMFGEMAFPADFKPRAEKRKDKPYPGKRGIVRPLAVDTSSGSEFRVPDAEGAPAQDGRRYHAAKDWFAPAGSPIRAPVAGKMVVVESSNDFTGQVFGGQVKIQAKDGKVWVFRHVVPRVNLGENVAAGEVVAGVSPWRDGPTHTHIEVWKTLDGGYKLENMIDPMKFF